MTNDQLKKELTQTRLKLNIAERTIKDLRPQIKSNERVIRELQLKNKKLQDVLIKINGLTMRSINDETQRLDKT